MEEKTVNNEEKILLKKIPCVNKFLFFLQVFIELINWKLEQLNDLADKELKELDTDIKFDDRQKAFDLMFKFDDNAGYFDQIQSVSSRPTTSHSVATLAHKNAKRYTIEAKRKKVATTKYWLQDVLGKTIIPGTTIVLLVLYFFVVLIQC